MLEQFPLGRLQAVRVGLVAVTAVLVVAGSVVYANSAAVPVSEDAWGIRGFALAFAAVFAATGSWILSHRPRNTIGWILIIGAVLSGTQGFAEQWALYALGTRGGEASGGLLAAWYVDWVWTLGVAALAALLLVFPDGHLLGERWRKVVWLGPLGVGTSAALLALRDGQFLTWPAENPWGVLSYGREAVGLALLPFAAYLVAAIAALVIRVRRAEGTERTQLSWLMAFGVPGIAVAVVSGSLPEFIDNQRWIDGLEVLGVLLFGLIPVAIGIGIVRHQLFDIDLAVNRALVVGALVAFVTVVYAAFVGGVGALIGERANLTLSIGATGVVAVGFHPVRIRVQRWANRLVYGERATPYEVLSSVAAQLEGSVPTNELLGRITESLAEGTGATSAQVWLRVGDELRLAAAAPDAPTVATVRLDGGELPEIPGADHAAPVVHDGEVLGALALVKPRGEPVSAPDERLLDGLAGQAGLLLRNQRLTAELLDLVEQLRASRQRLVAAQDEERRRLERDLHDGAQQQIVALKLKATTAKTLLERGDSDRSADILDQLVDDTDEAVASLRELAHGIYPPLLEAEGLGPALRARASKAPVAVEVTTDEIRYPREVEAAVYFCVLEALQNVVKYADANRVEVDIAREDGQLRFRAVDDGAGFDRDSQHRGAGLTNMHDRIDALGGALEVTSSPGEGTCVEGRIPVGSDETS